MADLSTLLPLFSETVASIRARMDADVNTGLSFDDPRWIDTREGSFYWDMTQPAVLELARLWDALSLEVPAAAFPIFAWGQYLDAHAATFGLERKPAVNADGDVVFYGTPGAVVSTGAIVSAPGPSSASPTIDFATTVSGTIGAGIAVPTGLVATPVSSGGTLATGTYFYRVSAVNAFGETQGTPAVSAAVTGPAGSVSLDWADVAGATAYRVYRSSSAAGVGQRIYSAATSAYVDNNAATPGAAGPPSDNSTAAVALNVQAVDAGSAGNVGARGIDTLETANPGVTGVYNLLAMDGGQEIESDEALRARLLLEFQGSGAGNANDYRRWALRVAGVGRVFVQPVAFGPGSVLVVVMTADGDPVSAATVAAVQAYLDPTIGAADGEAPIGITVTVQTPQALSVPISGVVTFRPGFSLDGTGGTVAQRALIVKALGEYVDRLDVGDDVVYQHVQAQFFRAEGVYSVAGVTVGGGTADIVVTLTPAQIAQLGAVSLT